MDPFAQPQQGPSWADFVAAWELFRDPVLSAGIAGLVLGFLAVYVVLRRMVFVSAAVTQGAGLGVALAFYAAIHLGIDIDPGLGAVATALLIAGLLVLDPGRLGLSRETVLGLAFALCGGGAVLVGARISQEAHDIQAILFGIGVMVAPEDLRAIEIAALALMLVHLWLFRGLCFASFDPVAARVQGLPVRVLDAVLLASLGIMIGVAARALGSLPVFALSTMPGAAAVLLGRGRLALTFALAAALGSAAGVGGYLLAFFWELPVGGAQTVLAVVIAIAAALALAAARALAGLMRRG
ncbi:metal ABC transporter permease [Haliangium ochraceum]|uniref:ABC-3 protein n=1 Tax=Haliangium ochraceum (strain DSM 14365 / JCM 11303 / SMP-2) TaxID=502025 RepID=D0LZF8_HALO1|nr:metal ABC transporter permease [Haliangium ochraceum]ACY16420.1 ABC-3 protein [Haliangium ochraceum DSM 14365]